jgi:hypothetical protein
MGQIWPGPKPHWAYTQTEEQGTLAPWFRATTAPAIQLTGDEERWGSGARARWGCVELNLVTGEGGVSPFAAAHGGTVSAGGDSRWLAGGAAEDGA